MFLQLLQEILRMPVERPKIPYMTVIGAAVAANMAVNVWGDTTCLSPAHTPVAPLPNLSHSGQYLNKKYGQWKEAVEWSMQKLHIRGADIIAKTTVEVTPGKLRDYQWNGHGFGLLIPDDALPPDSSTLTMTIQASLSGQYQFPDDIELDSGIYWVTAFPRVDFLRPITIKVQHSSNQQHCDQQSPLVFLTTDCNQKTLPHQFQPLPGGNFTASKGYGTIEVTKVLGVAVGRKKREKGEEKCYNAHIYYIPQESATTWTMHFTLTSNLELCHERVENYYSSINAEAGPHVEVIFDGDEVSLDIPEQGTQSGGWSLLPLVYPPVLSRSSIDNYEQSRPIPACQVELDWVGKEEPPKKLSYELYLKGVQCPGTYIRIIRNPTLRESSSGVVKMSEEEEETSRSESWQSQSPAKKKRRLEYKDFRDFGKPTPEQLMNLVGCNVKNKWRAIGTGLKVKEANLTSIQEEEAGKDDAIQHCMQRVFLKWKSAMTSDYIWQNLANVLESPNVDEKAAVLELHKSLWEHYTVK